jgi:protein-disulfide isomerase
MNSMLKLPFSTNRDHFIGKPEAALELVQYGDFQCEFCGEAYTAIKLLREYLGDKLKFVFRHYPLLTLHPLALDAAVASEAAALQGKFWPMHDMIFVNQKYLARGSFSRFAEEMGLNLTAFEDNREHKKLMHKVVNDFESGLKSGVDATPTFFVNGHRYNGFEDFKSLLKTCNYAINFDSIMCYV